MVHTQTFDACVLCVFENYATYLKICTYPCMYAALAPGFELALCRRCSYPLLEEERNREMKIPQNKKTDRLLCWQQDQTLPVFLSGSKIPHEWLPGCLSPFVLATDAWLVRARILKLREWVIVNLGWARGKKYSPVLQWSSSRVNCNAEPWSLLPHLGIKDKGVKWYDSWASCTLSCALRCCHFRGGELKYREMLSDPRI